MRNYTRTGSAVLIVILVLSAVALWCLTMMKTVSLNTEMALKRQEREQRYRMAHGVMHYGLWLCKQRFAVLQERASEHPAYDFDVGTWKLENALAYTGKLHLGVHDNVIDLQARLYDTKQQPVFSITCELVCQHEGEKGQEQTVFIVRHWNAGV